MVLDKTFENEIKKAANGDGGREHRFALLQELKKVSAALANRCSFENCLQRYGRAKVALCVASTISREGYRFEDAQYEWAMRVLDVWTNKYSGHVAEAIINIHPAILTDKSSSLRRATVV
jgi:hypothetical protein